VSLLRNGGIMVIPKYEGAPFLGECGIMVLLEYEGTPLLGEFGYYGAT
jgi:hypothetical protein